jgi:molecular chaperone GrpE
MNNSNINITKEEFESLNEFEKDTVYFLTDTQDLYINGEFIANLSFEIGESAKILAELASKKALETFKDNINSEYKDKYLYLMAEFDNYKKRNAKENADIVKMANEKIIKSLITVIDDFERSFKFIKDESREGVMLIYDKFIKLLEDNNVECINPSDGEAFDETMHEVVAVRPAENDSAKGLILECLEKGYILNGKVIRFAKVVVQN